MMREIKLRAWDKWNAEWMYIDDLPISDLLAEWPSVHFMQYTGLKDKNGKEIYEGDIVTADRLVCVVEWRGCGWKATWKGDRDYIGGSPDLGFRIHEIIGNIYENPELIAAQED